MDQVLFVCCCCCFVYLFVFIVVLFIYWFVFVVVLFIGLFVVLFVYLFVFVVVLFIYLLLICLFVVLFIYLFVLLFAQNDELQVKLSRFRNRSVLELNQGLQEKTEKFEKEKTTLMEQNKQLRAELDKINTEKEQLMTSRQDQETELRELRQNKDLLTQWERQIADIIQWVTEEKDARCVYPGGVSMGVVYFIHIHLIRAYLKSVAKKLADDVDNLKTSANTLGKVNCIVFIILMTLYHMILLSSVAKARMGGASYFEERQGRAIGPSAAATE